MVRLVTEVKTSCDSKNVKEEGIQKDSGID